MALTCVPPGPNSMYQVLGPKRVYQIEKKEAPVKPGPLLSP
jgi:hypothetical protein